VLAGAASEIAESVYRKVLMKTYSADSA